MRNLWDKVKKWVVNHKIWSIVIAIVFIVGCFAVGDAQNDTQEDYMKGEQQHQSDNKDSKTSAKSSKEGKQLNKEKQNYKETKEEIKKGATAGKFDGMEYDKGNKKLVITLKNIDGFSDSGKDKNINQEVVYTVRNASDTKLDVDTIAVNVNGQYQDEELNKETLRELTSEWDIEKAKKLDHTNLIQVQEHPEQYATIYQKF